LQRDILGDVEGFEWDQHNIQKLWDRHRVMPFEAEEVFFSDPIFTADDAKHSGTEARYYVLGQTAAGRKLFVAFTLREKLARVISARDMSRRERVEFSRL
jgi:uncharacterized DUF497 family protein